MNTKGSTYANNKINIPTTQNELELQKRKCMNDMYTIAIMHTHLILADIDELLELTYTSLKDKEVLGFKYKISVIVDASLEFYRSILQRAQIH